MCESLSLMMYASNMSTTKQFIHSLPAVWELARARAGGGGVEVLNIDSSVCNQRHITMNDNNQSIIDSRKIVQGARMKEYF